MKLDIQTVVDLRFPVEDTDPKRVPICDLANFSEFHGIEKIVIREGGGGGGTRYASVGLPLTSI